MLFNKFRYALKVNTEIWLLKYIVITCTLYGLFVCLFMLFNATFNNIFNYIVVAVSFIGGVNQSNWSKPPTCRKS